MREGARIYLTCTVLQVIIILALTFPATAAEFTVNSTLDKTDLTPGNGLCVAFLTIFPPFVIPHCTVRAAIEETNALPGSDTINIPSGAYVLDIAGTSEDSAFTGDLDITDDLVILGRGKEQTSVDGNGIDRVFDILNPDTRVTIQHLTITNGTLPIGLSPADKGGAGIRNHTNLTLSNVVLKSNRIKGTSPGDAGGGILNRGTCTITNTTISENHAVTGGGIFNGPGGNLSISSSTIYKNDSLSGGGVANEGETRLVNTTISGNTINTDVYPFGGGIYNTAILEILQSTITDNTAPGPGDGIANEGYVRIANTIIAENGDNNCYLAQPIDSSGSNLDDDSSCSLGTSSDIINMNPRLDSLQDHGGPTQTHGLLIGSPAVDQGQNLAPEGITTDQRGVKRPDGEQFDIGAFETRKRSVIPLSLPLICCGS